MLKEGIRILANSSENSVSAISINTGTEIPRNGNYMQGALIPKNTFRSLSDAEKTIVFTNQNNAAGMNYNEIIKIIQLPENLQNMIRSIHLNSLESYEQLEDTVTHEDFKILAKNLMEYVGSKSLTPEIYNLGIQIEPGNEYTTTKQSDEYVGLHIDSWDRQPVSERKNSRNRICFNIGKGSRYLYFINIPVTDLCSEFPEDNIDHIVTDFLMSNPDYPVLRIQIKPFEGYIAPTEYIIHDGSTAGSNFKDVTFTVRSNFY